MDTITQAALGATVGQAVAGPQLGRRAAWFGAAAGVLPDLDVVTRAFIGEFGSMQWHRGPTHALWFGPLVGPLLGYAVWRLYNRRPRSESALTDPGHPYALRPWMWVFCLGLFTHPLLDVFTTYGTQLLSPFSNHRFALNGVGIVDPVYTLPLVLALILGRHARRRGDPGNGRRAAVGALLVTSAYLGLGVWVNHQTEARARAELTAAGMPDAEVRAYPTLLQLPLRRTVARQGDEVRVAYLSLLNPVSSWTTWRTETGPAVDAVAGTQRGRIFSWFAMDQTWAETEAVDGGTRVLIHDLRYGLMGNGKKSLWGVQGVVADDGTVRSEITRWHNRGRPPDMKKTLAAMMRAAFGVGAAAADAPAGGAGP